MKIVVNLAIFSAVLIGFTYGYEYHVGVGIADITGPAAEVGMVLILSNRVFVHFWAKSELFLFIFVIS